MHFRAPGGRRAPTAARARGSIGRAGAAPEEEAAHSTALTVSQQCAEPAGRSVFCVVCERCRRPPAVDSGRSLGVRAAERDAGGAETHRAHLQAARGHQRPPPGRQRPRRPQAGRKVALRPFFAPTLAPFPPRDRLLQVSVSSPLLAATLKVHSGLGVGGARTPRCPIFLILHLVKIKSNFYVKLKFANFDHFFNIIDPVCF